MTQPAEPPAQPESERVNARAWLMWGLAASMFVYASFQRVSPSVMIEDLMRSFAASALILGNLSAFYFWSYGAIQIPVGVVVDRWGPRRVLTVSAFLCATGALGFAVATTLPAAYAGRILLGIGAGFGLITTLRLAVNWFPAHRYAMVAGLTVFLGNMGAIAAQAPLAAVIEVAGWRAAIMGSAAYAAVSAIAFWLLIRDAPPKGRRQPAAPMEHAPPRIDAVGGALLAGLRSVATNRQTWFITAYITTMAMPLLAFAGLWGVAYLMQVYGINRPHAAAMTSLVFLAWGLGAPVGGWLSDRMGKRKPLLIGVALLNLGVWLIILYVPGVPLAYLYVLLPLAGIGGSTMGICFAVVREHNVPTAAGAGTGFLNTGPIFCGGLIQPLSGWLLDLGWDGRMEDGVRIFSEKAYVDAFVIFPIAIGIALITAILLRETYCRQQVT